MTTATARRRLTRAAWWMSWVAVSATVTAIVVWDRVWSQQRLVTGRHDQAAVPFGWPWDWVVQDQRALDPPFPSATSLTSFDSPTTISWGRLAAALLVVFVVVTLVLLPVWSVARRLVARRRLTVPEVTLLWMSSRDGASLE